MVAASQSIIQNNFQSRKSSFSFCSLQERSLSLDPHSQTSFYFISELSLSSVSWSLTRGIKLLYWSTLLIVLPPAVGFPGGSVGKESACHAGDAGDTGSIPELGRSPGGEHGNPLQYSWLENPRTEGPGGLQSTGLQKNWT